MSIEHFQRFMYAYADEYRNQEDIEGLGDFFYLMDHRAVFEQWLENNAKNCSIRKKGIPQFTSFISLKSAIEKDLPLYAIALNEFFYDEFDYMDMKNKILPKKHGYVSQQFVADTIHVSRSLITGWKNGSRCPEKYEWWTLAIRVLKLDYQLLLPYMHMIGCTIDATCLDDLILYFAMCNESKPEQIYALLHKYGCSETESFFAPA